jgi:hypothetical protein
MSWPDWSELSDVIKALAALAWPLAIIILLLLFKRDVKALISRLRRGKFLGQEIELEADLNRLERATQQLPQTPPPPPEAEPPTPAVPGDSPPPKLDPLGVARQILTEAGTSPKAALMLLAAEVEAEVRKVLTNHGIRPTTRGNVLSALRELEGHPAFPSEMRDLIPLFYRVRNQVVHGFDADPDDALRAVDIGLRLLSALRNLSENAPVSGVRPLLDEPE